MASASTDLQALAQKLLSGDFDINLLDQIVGAAYDPISPHRAQANKALMQLQESPELWRMADTIIEQSQNPNSRFFGLQVLDDAIKIRYVEIFHFERSSSRLFPLNLLVVSLFRMRLEINTMSHPLLYNAFGGIQKMEDNTERPKGGNKELRGFKSHQNVIR